MDLNNQTSKPAPGLMRHMLDWLLLLTMACLLPWLVVYCTDFWFCTDYRFFPILLVSTFVVTGWQGFASRGNLHDSSQVRWQIGAAMWLLGGLLGVGAAVWFSPWLALAALVVVWMAWTLLRFGQQAWTRVVSWSLPMASLLLLPLSDATDPLFGFVALVTGSSSNMLDLLSIPQLPIEHSLDLRTGRLDVSSLSRGIGNPYLLGALIVLMCLLARPSWLICLLTFASVPAWAWGGAVLLATVGSLLAETYQIYVMVGYRLWIMQAVVLVGSLLAIWLFQCGLVKLLAPFTAYSEGVGGVHKFFNTVVLWPEPDPLRSRKARSENSEALTSKAADRSSRPVQLVLVGAAGLFVLAGAIGYFQSRVAHSSAANIWSLALHSYARDVNLASLVSQEALPVDFSGMKLVGFDSYLTPGTATIGSRTAVWTYAFESRTVQLSYVVPLRGFYPRERLWLAGNSQVIEPRQALESEGGADGVTLLIDELTIQEPLAGPSYLAYATWSPHGQLGREAEIGDTWTWPALLASVTYQPTTASLTLFVAGYDPTATEQEGYRKILLDASRRISSQKH